MNTRNLPFAESPWGSAVAGGLCALASLVVLFLMRRMGLTRPGGAEPSRKSPSG
jgi:Mg2+ and Co2+ transporter CorA